MLYKAYGKINLSLNINGVREDGYHTLESIFLPIIFFDEVIIEKSNEMTFNCDKPYIRFDENNTIYKAIKLLKEEFDIKDNFDITLKKHIPMQAGLAGGSADAAAVIHIFEKLYNLHLTEEKIKELCLKIGADVLFTYYHKPALVKGIGDDINFIDIKDDYYVLIVKPRSGVSTKECYRLMNLDSCSHPDIEALRKALENGEDYIPYLGNSMEETAIKLLPDVLKAKELLMENGADFSLMSGSGSSVFTMSNDCNKIKALYDALIGKGFYVRHVQVLNNKK